MPTLPKSKRPAWLPKRTPFESGRVTKRWDGYNTAQWREFRAWFRNKHPICSVEGCKQPTYYVDHVIPVVDYMAQGGSPVDPANCQPLCFKHGNQKTGHEGKAKQMKK